MRHLKQLFVFALISLFSVSMWATEYELMLTLDVTTGAPGGSTSTALNDATLLEYLQGAASAATDITAASKTGDVYKGKGSGGGTIPQACLKIGKASGGGTISFSVANTYDDVTKVEITGYGWKTSTAVAVNSSATQSPAVAQSQVYTFSYELASGTKSIEIAVTSSAFCATEIKLYKTKSGGTPTPSLSATPTTIDFGTVEQDAIVADKTVAVSFANLTGSVTYAGLSSPFSASGTIASTGDEITISANTETAGDYSQTLTIQSAADSKSVDVTVKMKVVAPLTPIVGGIVDELYISDFEVTGGYTAFTDKQASNTGHSDAVYAGTVARNGNATQYNIQLNSGQTSSKQREIVTSTSGGYVRRVQAIWATQSANTAGRKLTVYGSETAYDGSEAAASGTSLGELTYAVGDAYAYIDIASDYPYIQIVANGAIYMDQINVTWVSSAATVAKPVISGNESFLTSTDVTLTCATAGATIYYTTDGTDPKTSGTKQSGTAFTLTNTATVRAIANLGSDWSAEATSKTFTKITPINVAAAIALIPDAGNTVDDQYVSGIVCTAGTAINSGKMTYWISDDGSETSRLQIYKGKNLGNTNFTNLSELALGDRVVVFGQLKNYSGTYEMNDGNYIVVKEDPAVAAPVFSPDGGAFMGETDVTITCGTAGSAIYYTLDGTAPSKSSTPYSAAIHLTETKTITAIAYVGDEHSIVVAKTFTYTSPMTVAAALAALDSEDPINNVAVSGIVSTAPASNPSSGKLTYYISDDGTATDELEVFNGYGLNGASFSAKTDLQVGDEVTVFGNLTIYNSTTKEFSTGSRLLTFNRPALPTYDITYVENGANEDIPDETDVTHLPDPLPTVTKDDKLFGGWFTDSEFNTPALAGAVLTGDVTLYAKWNDISPWAYVYTSNVDIAGDVAAHVTIGENTYDAAKANKAGTTTITLPAGVTTIHLHLVAWNGEAQTVTVSGACFDTDKNLTIEANAGVSGSGTTYNLGASGVSYYFSLTPDNAVAADEVITITAASNKRFVLFGVNQEGGIVPVLESIEISGDLTNKTGYKVGDDLDLDGLTVVANYTLGGTPQTPVDITNDPELVMSYDPLVVDQTEVTITATYKGQTDDITITGLDPVASATPVIYVSPSLNINFGSVEKDAAVADKTITVTLTNVAAATATLGGTDPTAFSIDKTALVDGDVVTISVASTATVNSYAATITISDDAGVATSKVVNLSLTVTEPETPDDVSGTWTLVTDAATLVAGKKVIIAQYVGADGAINTMAGQATNNRSVIASTVAGSTLTPATGTKVMTLADAGSGNFYLKTSDDEYLYNASSSTKSYLRTKAASDDASWTISVTAEGVATIASVENTNRTEMRYNENGTNPALFNCYASGQSDIALYMHEDVTPTPDYTRTVTVGKIGTLCVDHNVPDLTAAGAVFYQIAGKASGKLEFVEVDALEAGKPYIFQATEDAINLYYGATSVANPVEYKGMVGSFSDTHVDIDDSNKTNIMYIANNKLWDCSDLVGSYLDVVANRAYIFNYAGIDAAPAHAPGKRYIVVGKDVATGFDQLEASEAPMKLIMDGRLYILRGEKLYDATGRLVK